MAGERDSKSREMMKHQRSEMEASEKDGKQPKLSSRRKWWPFNREGRILPAKTAWPSWSRWQHPLAPNLGAGSMPIATENLRHHAVIQLVNRTLLTETWETQITLQNRKWWETHHSVCYISSVCVINDFVLANYQWLKVSPLCSFRYIVIPGDCHSVSPVILVWSYWTREEA